MAFDKQAVREQISARISLAGPSGSGKTYTALRLARGLAGPAGKIGLIDTEKDRALHYARVELADGSSTGFDFYHQSLYPPFKPDSFVELIEQAADAELAVLVIDSGSAEWSGPGGCLEWIDELRSGGSNPNKWAGWSTVTPAHNRFMGSIARAPCHVIVCYRGKDEWVVSGARNTPEKIGVGPDARSGTEYEYTVGWILDREHRAAISKGVGSLYDGLDFTPRLLTEDDGAAIKTWCNQGRRAPAPPDPPVADSEWAQLREEIRQLEISSALKSATWKHYRHAPPAVVRGALKTGPVPPLDAPDDPDDGGAAGDAEPVPDPEPESYPETYEQHETLPPGDEAGGTVAEPGVQPTPFSVDALAAAAERDSLGQLPEPADPADLLLTAKTRAREEVDKLEATRAVDASVAETSRGEIEECEVPECVAATLAALSRHVESVRQQRTAEEREADEVAAEPAATVAAAAIPTDELF